MNNPDRAVLDPPPLLSQVDEFIVGVWDEVERFLADRNVAPTSFSRDVSGDPNLVRHIRERRRKLTFTMAVRLKHFIEAQGAGAATPPASVAVWGLPRRRRRSRPIVGSDVRR